jgi:hypothetical protein
MFLPKFGCHVSQTTSSPRSWQFSCSDFILGRCVTGTDSRSTILRQRINITRKAIKNHKFIPRTSRSSSRGRINTTAVVTRTPI